MAIDRDAVRQRSERIGYRIGCGLVNVPLSITRFARGEDVIGLPPVEQVRLMETRRRILATRVAGILGVPWLVGLVIAAGMGSVWPHLIIAAGLAGWLGVTVAVRLKSKGVPVWLWPLMLAGGTIGVQLGGAGQILKATLMIFGGIGLAALAGWIVWAGWDGDLGDNLPAAEKATGVTDEQIRLAVARAVGLRPDQLPAAQTVGAGLTWDDSRRWWTTRIMVTGKTGDDICGKLGDIAAYLGMGKSQLLGEVDATNNAIATLHGCVGEPWPAKPTRHPLVATPAQTSVWEAQEIGIDIHGAPVRLPVLRSKLIGGLPDFGKSIILNNLYLPIALDPHTELWLADGKGLDTEPLRRLATRCVTGQDLQGMIGMLKDLAAEMDARTTKLQTLGAEKLTPEIAANGVPPIILGIDELARYVGASAGEAGKTIMGQLIQIASLGRAVGIHLVLATQRPSSKIVDTDLRDLIPIRIAVQCTTSDMSEMILGDRTAKAGIDASQLGDIPGAALVVAGKKSRRIRSHLVQLTDLRKVCVVAEQLRAVPAASSTTEPDPDEAPIIGRIRTIITYHGEDYKGGRWMRSTELAKWLDMDPKTLASEAAKHGVRPAMYGPSRTMGYCLSHVP